MEYVTFRLPDQPRQPRLGIIYEQHVVDLPAAAEWLRLRRGSGIGSLPTSMLGLIHAGPEAWDASRQVAQALASEPVQALVQAGNGPLAWERQQVRLMPPLPRPMSVRDFYAFEEHVSAARAARGLEVPEAWYEFPVFYFSNANAAYGPDESVSIPRYSQALDYELEVACVIGQAGRDIPADRAGAFIFGYTIFNDWSARDVQRREMQVGLGPAKGKDFAASFGPSIVTPDALEDRSAGRPGVYDLKMQARVNSEIRSSGNWQDLHYSFGEMIERASAEVFLLPGEIIGSGTVGSGSLLELTGGEGPWLAPEDEVELEIERLGVLRNTIAATHGAAAPNATMDANATDYPTD